MSACLLFFFHDTATTEIYTLSLHDALPILTYTIVSEPSNGTLDGSGPKVIYRPAPGFSGADSFTFKVNDGVIDSPTATVSDRKSTRLNSSHANISYAVFCLKKKNIT